MTHLSPQAVAWIRERIAVHNDCERSPIKSVALAGAARRRDLIDLLVTFTGADRDELRKLTAKPEGTKP